MAPGPSMDGHDLVRELCARATATSRPEELDAILSQLRAVVREHIARIESLIEERRRRANPEHELSRAGVIDSGAGVTSNPSRQTLDAGYIARGPLSAVRK
jgi:hypothetical protein